MPLNLIKKYLSWPFGKFVCSYIFPLSDVLPAVSVITILAISIDRYRAICYALSRVQTLTAGVTFNLVIWALCYLTLGLPLVFVLTVSQSYWKTEMCDAVWPNMTLMRTYYTCRFTLFFVYPSIVIFLCYKKTNLAIANNLQFLSLSVSGVAQAVHFKTAKANNYHVLYHFHNFFHMYFACYGDDNLICIHTQQNGIVEALWKRVSNGGSFCLCK